MQEKSEETFTNTDSDNQYQELFNSIEEGFCIIKVLFDENMQPFDYRFLETNTAFEYHTGLSNVVGKTVREFAPQHEDHWFQIYGKVALTGEPARFQNSAEQLGRFYNVYAYRFGRAEDRQVAVLFNDITKQKSAESELIKKDERFLTTLDNLKEGCAIVSSNWEYLYVNDVSARHAHMKKEDMTGRKMTELFPGIENSDFFKKCKICMTERTYQQTEGSYTFSDGSKEWFESFVQPVPEGIFILSLDITKRKTAELKLKKALYEKEILIRELYHRSKNNIQIISSLLNMRGSASSDPAIKNSFFEIRDSIRSMALVHEKLYQSGSLSRINLKYYLRELVNLLISSHACEERIDLIYALSDVEVTFDTAIPFGLIVTELVLNTIKYAYPAGENGNLYIVLNKSDENIINLIIRDDGEGIQDKELNSESSFGLQLVKSIIEDQLNGEMKLEKIKGTSWQIKINAGSYIERV